MDGMTFKIRSVHLLTIISKSDGFVGVRMENITTKGRGDDVEQQQKKT